MSYYRGTHKVAPHRLPDYQTKKKAQKQEVEVDGKTYIISIPSGNEIEAEKNSREK